MQSVLISIKPKWCELIANGKKTVEVRKTAPKEVPFKCYIYCTWGNLKENYMLSKLGKIIGEFICDKIYYVASPRYTHDGYAFEELNILNRVDLLADTCLSNCDLAEYLQFQDGYGWHISNLKIYDKPKELSDFKTRCIHKGDDSICGICKKAEFSETYDLIGCRNRITRPPQSWQYVEE